MVFDSVEFPGGKNEGRMYQGREERVVFRLAGSDGEG